VLLLLLLVRPDVVAVGTGTMVARHGDGGLRVALWLCLRQHACMLVAPYLAGTILFSRQDRIGT
jgi:hypothetical protein